MPSGYIGVDIFFVISGYLIIGSIWKDLNNKNFHLMLFYNKRIMRLFPALLFMIITSSIAAYFILLPQEAIKFYESLVSTVFYVSNFYFYLESDYFNSAMKLAPLLHTWSLSVEEQFYLIFPLVLILIYSKYMKSIFKILMILATLSLVLSQFFVYQDISFAFYASPTRFFQFILGGIIAIQSKKYLKSKYLNYLLSIIGFSMIVLSIFLYNEKVLFPGINALLPSIGSVLILFSKNKYSTLFLSNKLLLLIGNSSYSIYLWHWPLIVFYKLKVSPSLNGSEQIILLLTSILLGYLSWKYIEEVTRYKLYGSSRLKIIYITIGTSIFLSIFLLPIFSSLSSKYKNKISEYLDYNVSYFRGGECFLSSSFDTIDYFNKDLCITYNKNKKNYLLVGDSHAAHFYSALNASIKSDETITQVTASGCHPVLPYQGTKRCTDLVKWAFDELIVDKHFDLVILSSNWGYFDKNGMIDTINNLLKHVDNIVILGPSLLYKQALPRLLVNLPQNEDMKLIYKTTSKYKEVYDIDWYIKEFIRKQKNKRVKYISILKTLCNKKGCVTTTEDGVPINFDGSHFTQEGAYYVIQKIKKDLFMGTSNNR